MTYIPQAPNKGEVLVALLFFILIVSQNLFSKNKRVCDLYGLVQLVSAW